MPALQEPLPWLVTHHMLDGVKTISLSELSQRAAQIAKDIHGRRGIVRVRAPRGNLLLMDWKYYEGWRALIELLERPNWREDWEESQRELALGKGRELSEVMAEIRRDRRAQRKSGATAARSAGTRTTKARGGADDARRSSAKRRRTAR